jgi:hypothetical protein
VDHICLKYNSLKNASSKLFNNNLAES